MITKIKAAHLAARKARNNVATSVLSVVIADLDRKQNHDNKACIKSITAIVEANRGMLVYIKDADQITKLETEIKVVEELLPVVMPEAEMFTFVTDYIADSGVDNMSGMRGLIEALNATGKVINGGLATKIFKQELGL